MQEDTSEEDQSDRRKDIAGKGITGKDITGKDGAVKMGAIENTEEKNVTGEKGAAERIDERQVLKAVDHTLLAQTATWEEIKTICDDAMECQTASVCIPPSFVSRVKAYVGGRIPVCTVIGFPNGYQTTAVKLFETKDTIENGADEIDMVIDIGAVKEGHFDQVEEEIRRLKEACGEKILKVIVETCLLTEEEKIRMCQIVTQAGADFIKTSTGFSKAGATFEDVALFAAHVGPGVRIKAAGGISSFADGQHFLDLGASRLGTSRLVKLYKQAAT